jgi:hypothetical protein
MILEKYENRQTGNLLLPVIGLYKYNSRLKKIAEIAGIEKRITSHIARHSILSFRLKISNLQEQNF